MTRSNRTASHQLASNQATPQLSIGQIVGASGLRGEVRLHIWTHFPERIPHLGQVYVEGEGTPRRLLGARVRGTVAVLRLEGIETRDQAEALRGRVLRIDLAQAAPLAADEYYHFQVLGLRVVDENGRSLGEVVEILETGANDVYLVRSESGEILLPALRSVVLEIDLDRRVMMVRPPQYYEDERR